MDAQLKRGLLEACVLTLLKAGDSYGYQLIKDVSGVIEVSESTLYPILRRLEAGQYLRVYSVERNSRLRRYYAITPLGRQRLKNFMLDWAEVSKVYEFICASSGEEAGEQDE